MLNSIDQLNEEMNQSDIDNMLYSKIEDKAEIDRILADCPNPVQHFLSNDIDF